MDLAEIELLRRINAKFDRKLGWDEYVVGIRSTLVKTWTQSLASESSPGKLVNPEAFKQSIDQRVAQVTEGIRSLGVQIIGDVGSLSVATYGSNTIPSSIDIENLVDPILARTRLTTLDSYKASELGLIAIKRVIRNRIKDLKVLLGKKQKAI
jgi:hypothetical protein